MSARRHVLGLLAACCLAAAAPAAEVKLLLPQNRTAFQTNEWIDVSVVRRAPQDLAAGELKLTLAGADGSRVETTFAAPAVAAGPQRKEGSSVEHLHVNGWLLRPGKYTVTAAVDGATASTEIEVFSHVRQSSFRLINWGRAKGKEQLVQGEHSLGFNLFYGHGMTDTDANFLRAGVDFMSNCTMGGGHQMDLRNECDWSDPLVLRGGTRRVVRQAMNDRTRPHVPGVHFYDEPGLTWEKNDATGEFTPHGIRSQVRSYEAAFGRLPPDYDKLDPKNPKDVERWRHWATWKLGLMDASWKEAQFGVSRVRPDYLSLTQSQYGWTAFTDGYYFNVVRSLPVTSGHGGYHDFGPGFFNPSYFMEMSRARDFGKPCWYLPTWYGNTTSDQYRLEQYLSFQTHLQGMMSPPDLEPATNASARQGIVESNHLMKKLGPIFTTMPVTKPPVAMLYSLSQAIHTQTHSEKRGKNYAHEMPQGKNLPLTYLAGKLMQQQFLAVVDEDVIDGTLANDHKAVVLTSIDYLEPQVVKALEGFADNGGLVLMTGDSTVPIKGAVKLDVKPRMPDQEAIDKLMEAKKYDQLGPYTTTAKHVEGATPLAKAIRAELAKKGIKPIVECDVPTIVVTRQAAGDVEYIFAVNATPDAGAKDPKGNPEKNAPKAVVAHLKFEAGPMYDAILGGSHFPELPTFTFGPGQMRVFARTRRPIGGIRISAPVLGRDLVGEQKPLAVEFAATVVDGQCQTISGSIPLHIRVVDPLGVARHDLYRATKLGQFSMRLPLAANDPAGKWTVSVSELLNNSTDSATFEFTPPRRARAIAGSTPRAVYHGNDRDNLFRFARTHHEVTIVKGASAYNDAAAKRLAKALEPWGVRCKEMDLLSASKSRKLTEEEARTWCGLVHAGKGQIKPGDGNSPALVGFAVQGPVILLGTPEDNALVKFLAAEKFLPYAPSLAEFPGPGRGMIAWQRDGVGAGQESVTLIGYDEAGMAEAVGSFYEAVAGIEPLTRWTLPTADAITPAKTAVGSYPAAKVVWTAALPDRVWHLFGGPDGVVVLSHDLTQMTLSANGKVTKSEVLTPAVANAWVNVRGGSDNLAEPAVKKQARPDRMTKLGAADYDRAMDGRGRWAVAYWGGTLRIVDKDGTILTEQELPQDVTALTWAGDRCIVGLADGRVLALDVK